MNIRAFWAISTAAAALVFASSTQAAQYWSGSGNWSTTEENWASESGGPYDSAWTSGGTAVFEGEAGTATLTATYPTAGSISFATTGYAIVGSATSSYLTLNGDAAINTGANAATINAGIAGTAGLTKVGAGTLSLTSTTLGNLSYTGDTNINEGVLQLGETESATNPMFTSSSRTIYVNSGATLKFNYRNALGFTNSSPNTAITINGGTVTSGTATSTGVANVLRNLTLQNGGVLEVTRPTSGNGVYLLKGTVTAGGTSASSIIDAGYSGYVQLGNGANAAGSETVFDVADIDGTDAELVVSATVKNTGTSAGYAAGLRKIGDGTLVLAGANTGSIAYTGDTNIDAGTLQIGNAESSVTAFTSSARNIYVNAGGTLKLMYRNAFTTSNGSPLTAVTINGGTVCGTNGSVGTSNVLNNLTFKNGGVLSVTKPTSYGTYMLKGTVTVAAGTAVAASSIIDAGHNGYIQLGDGSTVGSTTTFDVADVTGNDNADLTIDASIWNAGANGGGTTAGLVKTGDGALALGGDNRYTANTTINQGTLMLTAGSSMLIDINTTGDSTQFLGTGSLCLGGKLLFDLAGVTGEGAWQVVSDSLAKSYVAGDFSVALRGGAAFTAPTSDDVWTYYATVGGQAVALTFDESAGLFAVTAVPEPAGITLLAMAALATIMYVRRRNR